MSEINHEGVRDYAALSHASSRRAPFRVSLPVVSGTLRLADLVIIIATAALCYASFVHGRTVEGHAFILYAMAAALGTVLMGFVLQLAECYNPRRLGDFRWQVGGIFYGWCAAGLLGLGVAYMTKSSVYFSRGFTLGWVFSSSMLLVSSRLVLVGLLRAWSASGALTRTIVVVGANLSERLIERIKTSGDPGLRVAGVFDDRRTRVPRELAGVPVLGTTNDLIAYARRELPDEVIIALPLFAHARIAEIFTKLRLLPVDLRLALEGLDEAIALREIVHVGEVPVAKVADRPLGHWNGVVKRLADLSLAAVFIVLLAPVMLAAAIAIKLDSPGPILFRQDRFGFNNKVFKVLKFRTMRIAEGDPTGGVRTVKNDPRVTGVGRWLRSWSIDELPQLINVLRGEMSLVGPRAHAVTMRAGEKLYHDAVKQYFARHNVKPGLTGWAQINGLRGEINSVEKAQLRVDHDLWYIDHWSILLDLKILVLTARLVLWDRADAY
jgi:Undecaprenyl-phosphate glucose phosphotransferase